MEEITETKSKFPVKGFIIGCSVLFLGFVVLALVGLGVFTRSLIVTIEPDEVAVVLSPYEPNGIREIPLTPGRHLLDPFDKFEIFNFGREKYLSSSANCNCGSEPVIFHTKDGAEILINYQITYSINAEQVVNLYNIWQHRYQDGFVIPHSKQIVEEITSQYTSNEIALAKRKEIEKKYFYNLNPIFQNNI